MRARGGHRRHRRRPSLARVGRLVCLPGQCARIDQARGRLRFSVSHVAGYARYSATARITKNIVCGRVLPMKKVTPQNGLIDPRKPEILLYCDGACSPNPGCGGWACVLLAPARGLRKELSG